MFNLFKAKDVILRFKNTESFHKFESTLVLGQFVERNAKKTNSIETITGGFEDGHVEVTYPVKRNKIGDFAKAITYYNHFFPNEEAKLVG